MLPAMPSAALPQGTSQSAYNIPPLASTSKASASSDLASSLPSAPPIQPRAVSNPPISSTTSPAKTQTSTQPPSKQGLVASDLTTLPVNKPPLVSDVEENPVPKPASTSANFDKIPDLSTSLPHANPLQQQTSDSETKSALSGTNAKSDPAKTSNATSETRSPNVSPAKAVPSLSEQAQSVQRPLATSGSTNESLASQAAERQRVRMNLNDNQLVDAPPSNPTSAPALSFSRSLLGSRSESRKASNDQSSATGRRSSSSQKPDKAVNMLTLTPDHIYAKDAKEAAKASQPAHSVNPSISSSVTSSPSAPTKSAMKPKSWAELLKNPSSPPQPGQAKRVSIALPGESSNGSVQQTGAPSQTNGVIYPGQDSPISIAFGKQLDANKKKSPLEERVRGVETQFVAPMLQPRGMINRGNMCFENTIFQALLLCGPFWNFIRLMDGMIPEGIVEKTKLLQATIALFNQIRIASSLSSTSQEYVEPLLPEGIYDALKQDKRFSVMQRGQQEDAQEFLGLLLEALHEEILLAIDNQDDASMKRSAPNGSANDEDWLEVGSKGRTATTRKADVRESPITKIFGGIQRSLLRVPGQKDSALSEPFLTLQLDIQPHTVETIEDALANLSTPETVNDYVIKGGLKVDANKQLFLEQLPPVLILHLKRFSYNNIGGTIKNSKIIGYKDTLEISPALMTAANRAGGPVRYRLSAIVYHHGRTATGGHYTVVIRQQNGQWIDIDDTTIRQISAGDVAIDKVQESLRLSLPSANSGHTDGLPDRTAYLMWYTKTEA